MKNSPKYLLFLFVSCFVVLSCSKDNTDKEIDDDEQTTIEITVEDFNGSVNENAANDTTLGTVSASTNEGTLEFSLVSQNPDGAVAINGETGELSIADNSIFNYEENTSVSGVVKATVKTVSETLDFTITINDVSDSQIAISSSNEFTINENSETGTVIGTVSATTDSSMSLSYSIEEASVSGAITINATSGVVTVVDSALFDFETLQEITATIKVALGTLSSKTQEITITIADVAEAVAVSTFAGSAQGYVDGDISVATFDRPSGIALDDSGNMYVAEYGNHAIRKITPQGVVTTLAGGFNGYMDGTGTNARLFRPSDIIMGNDGFLYVADTWNNRIRKVSLNGEVTTLAGSTSGFQDGYATNAKFNKPTGLTMDANGNIYVTDLENQRIRKIDPNGEVTTLAGGTSGYDDGTGADAQFRDPTGIVINSNNELFVTDYFGRTIRKVSLDGVVTTWAGSGIAGSFNRTRSNSSFGTPNGIAMDNQGDILVSDATHNNIRKISITVDEVTTVAGMGDTSSSNSGYVDGIAPDARFYEPSGLVVAANGTIYVADYQNHRIRAIK